MIVTALLADAAARSDRRAARWLAFAAPVLVSVGHGRALPRPRPQGARLALLSRVPLDLAHVVGRLDPRARVPGEPARRRSPGSPTRRRSASRRSPLASGSEGSSAPRGRSRCGTRPALRPGEPLARASRSACTRASCSPRSARARCGARRCSGRSSSSPASRPAPRSCSSSGSTRRSGASSTRWDRRGHRGRGGAPRCCSSSASRRAARPGHAAAGLAPRRRLHRAVLEPRRHRRARRPAACSRRSRRACTSAATRVAPALVLAGGLALRWILVAAGQA